VHKKVATTLYTVYDRVRNGKRTERQTDRNSNKKSSQSFCFPPTDWLTWLTRLTLILVRRSLAPRRSLFGAKKQKHFYSIFEKSRARITWLDTSLKWTIFVLHFCQLKSFKFICDHSTHSYLGIWFQKPIDNPNNK
jgi:hypothetical protein